MKKSDGTNSSEIESAQEPNLMARLRREYREADGFARRVADYRENVAIPANNELRYAGFHLIEAIADDCSLSDEEAIGKAIAHCQRAKYEAAEAGIMWALKAIANFQNDYRTTPITDVLVDYIDSCEKIENAQKEISAARNSGGNSPEKLIAVFDEISQIQKKFELARSELNKKMQQARKNYFWRTLALIAGFPAALAAIYGLLALAF